MIPPPAPAARTGLFLDAGDGMDAVFRAAWRQGDPLVRLRAETETDPADLPALAAGHFFLLVDHTPLPTGMLRRCPALRHVVFLGTGAESYMDPPALASHGIAVHAIAGYGDVAVAEHAMALMWAAARDVARMDRAIRAGGWAPRQGRQLTGATLGLVGYGGIAAELARLAHGIGMRVLAWNRTPRALPPGAPPVRFAPLDEVLEASDVLSLHLALRPETRGFLDRARLRRLRPGAIVVNTARAALLDEDALVEALGDGTVAHAALDVFAVEPLPPGDRLAQLANVTLTAHSAYNTPQARTTLVRRGLDLARALVAGGGPDPRGPIPPHGCAAA